MILVINHYLDDVYIVPECEREWETAYLASFITHEGEWDCLAWEYAKERALDMKQLWRQWAEMVRTDQSFLNIVALSLANEEDHHAD